VFASREEAEAAAKSALSLLLRSRALFTTTSPAAREGYELQEILLFLGYADSQEGN